MVWSVDIDVLLCRCSVVSMLMLCCVDVLLRQCFAVSMFCCVNVLLCVCSVVRVFCCACVVRD